MTKEFLWNSRRWQERQSHSRPHRGTRQGTHYLFTIMNTQKKGTFQFCFPGLLGIHRNPKWKEFLRSCESFLKKVSICTLTDLNPGFDGPWKKLWIFFVNGTFLMPQKKSFGQKIFWISFTGSKVPFWQNGKIAKMALLNPCMKFEFFFGKKTSFEALWMCHLLKVSITCPRVRQIQDLCS